MGIWLTDVGKSSTINSPLWHRQGKPYRQIIGDRMKTEMPVSATPRSAAKMFDAETMVVVRDLLSFTCQTFGWDGQRANSYVWLALTGATVKEHGRQDVMARLRAGKKLVVDHQLLIAAIDGAVTSNVRAAVDGQEAQSFHMEDDVWREAVEALRTPEGWLIAKLMFALGVPQLLVDTMRREAEIMP